MTRVKTTMNLDHELADFAVTVLNVANRTEAVDTALRLAVQRAAREKLRAVLAEATADKTIAELDAMREEGWR